jgi:hypothetical protein
MKTYARKVSKYIILYFSSNFNEWGWVVEWLISKEQLLQMVHVAYCPLIKELLSINVEI